MGKYDNDDLESAIFAASTSTFAVLDGASVPGLLEKFEQWLPEFICLYRGELKPDLAEVAPYLVRLELGSEFCKWVLSEGGGNHWGILAIAVADFHAMRQHFRRLLTVYDEDGKPLLFRFYDPRVLRTYLPTCTTDELQDCFGPVSTYLVEDHRQNDWLCWSLTEGGLEVKQIDRCR